MSVGRKLLRGDIKVTFLLNRLIKIFVEDRQELPVTKGGGFFLN
jgi:hypothetical protein